jgi:2-oxoglutarate/2-oxoacid ferredoxin oxidoreductase subunit alpha
MAKAVEERKHVVVRFAGDSGDGMQLTGDRFTNATAIMGNDLATLPDFPAEIRAPAGTLHGVSAFQIHFASQDILTPGDNPNVLVAMNPAALKANIGDLQAGGTIIANENAFVDRNLEKAGYQGNPLEDGSLEAYQVFPVKMTDMTVEATKGIEGITKKEAERAKNFFALGLVSWLYGRPTEITTAWIEKKFARRPEIRDANLAAFRAGYNFGDTAELFAVHYEVKRAPAAPGVYRNTNGTTSMAWGLIAASVKSGLPLFYSGYPITPASELLHELSKHKNFGVRTFQAEDEIAAANMALGAAFSGHLGVTGTSGPGVDLKAETISLAVTLELPMIIVDVQRAGPSTGMPTKTEAADLMLAMYGRHGESPLPIVAAHSPAHSFDAAFEAAWIAIEYRTPVILLSDTLLVNSSEPWRIPDPDSLPEIDPGFATEPNAEGDFLPYLRDEKLARPWAVPGTPGLQHRIGGLEKEAEGTGNISYDPENHERATHLRARKVQNVADSLPPLDVDDPTGDAELLVLGWGSTYGTIKQAIANVRDRGKKVAHAHLVHMHPFPNELGEILGRYPKVLVPEMNMGQLVKLVRAEYLVDAQLFSKVQGQPIFVAELEEEIVRRLA